MESAICGVLQCRSSMNCIKAERVIQHFEKYTYSRSARWERWALGHEKINVKKKKTYKEGVMLQTFSWLEPVHRKHTSQNVTLVCELITLTAPLKFKDFRCSWVCLRYKHDRKWNLNWVGEQRGSSAPSVQTGSQGQSRGGQSEHWPARLELKPQNKQVVNSQWEDCVSVGRSEHKKAGWGGVSHWADWVGLTPLQQAHGHTHGKLQPVQRRQHQSQRRPFSRRFFYSSSASRNSSRKMKQDKHQCQYRCAMDHKLELKQ